MARLIVSREAQDDIRTVVSYLRPRAGAVVADNYAEAFDRTGDLLVDFPGTPSPELGPQARRVAVDPYILIYDYDQSTDRVTLLRVVHGRRNITIELITRR